MLILNTVVGCGSKKDLTSEKEEQYYCEKGTLKGKDCEIVESEEAMLSCSDGYELNEKKCVKTTTTNAKVNQSCSEGYTLSGNTCVSKQDVAKKLENYCVESYTQHQEDNGWYYQALRVEGYSCVIRICTDGPTKGCYETTAEAKGRLVCPSGTKEINGKCYKTSKVKTTYSCDTGDLSGSKCNISDIKEPTNICKTDGYVYNDTTKQCEKITNVKALKK